MYNTNRNTSNTDNNYPVSRNDNGDVECLNKSSTADIIGNPSMHRKLS